MVLSVIRPCDKLNSFYKTRSLKEKWVNEGENRTNKQNNMVVAQAVSADLEVKSNLYANQIGSFAAHEWEVSPNYG